MTATENEEQRGYNEQQQPPGMEKRALVRVAVCVVTLWLVVLLLLLLLVVGMYTSQANQILVLSSVAVLSCALMVASCKLNSLAGLSKMVAEEVAAKADPPPTYKDVLESEVPPPPYFTVVSEAAGGGRGDGNCSNSARPIVIYSKEATDVRPEDNQAPKQLSSPRIWDNPVFRRWLGRPSILHSAMFRNSRSLSATTSQTQAVKVLRSRGLSLPRSSSTPSLSNPVAPPPLARCPSSPSVCDPCG